MLGKLAVRNTKRSIKDYLIYLITVTIAFSLIFAFNLVASSEEVIELSTGMDTFKYILAFVNVVIIFVICFLINYTTKFMFEKRSKELGTYMLLGIRKKEIARLLVIENVLLAICALVLAIPLGFIFSQFFFLALVVFLLIFYGVDTLFVVLLVILFISIQGFFQWCLYRKKRNASQHIIDLVDGLEETYYIADVLPKPKEFQNEAYYYAIKKACKSMNDEISKITEEKQEYQEYVESFAHEIKIPIGALSLTFDNTKNYTLKKETDKIFQLVEQMLYYARSENTEKDYFVKQLQLDEVIHNVILKFRHSLMERKTIINIHDIENVIYTDEKWLTFILSQIVQNAIKYFDKQENKLTIYSQDNGTNILLVIEDNGCGIKASDLSRVFEKGFTGSNRNKANATGMGLYLSKKLCDRLGLKLDIASTEKEYTRLTITFPKGTVHNFSE